MSEKNSPLAVCVVGAAGRMGRLLISELLACPEEYRLVGALEISSCPALGKDAALNAGLAPVGVNISDNPDEAMEEAQVVIDFSSPSAIQWTVSSIKRHKCPTLLATTSLTPADLVCCKKLASEVPLLVSPNFSLGIYALRRAVQEVSKLLADKGFEAELLEIHHNQKKDAPSGTAKLLLNDLLESGIARQPVYDRALQVGKRESDSLGVSVLRGGDVAGEHKVYFLGQGERLELSHSASTGALFPRGALKAARWLLNQPAGSYSMDDFFGA